MSKTRQWLIELVAKTANVPNGTAEALVDRLNDEGVLHLGYGDADIDQVIEAFQATYGTTKVSKQDRWAANRLVKRYGTQSVVGMIKLLAENSTEKYAPVVNNVSDLEDKWVSVLNFLRNIQKNEIIDNT